MSRKEIGRRAFEVKREQAMGSFCRKVEDFAQEELLSLSEDYGIPPEVFDRHWSHFVTELESYIFENFTIEEPEE